MRQDEKLGEAGVAAEEVMSNDMAAAGSIAGALLSDDDNEPMVKSRRARWLIALGFALAAAILLAAVAMGINQ